MFKFMNQCSNESITFQTRHDYDQISGILFANTSVFKYVDELDLSCNSGEEWPLIWPVTDDLQIFENSRQSSIPTRTITLVPRRFRYYILCSYLARVALETRTQSPDTSASPFRERTLLQ